MTDNVVPFKAAKVDISIDPGTISADVNAAVEAAFHALVADLEARRGDKIPRPDERKLFYRVVASPELLALLASGTAIVLRELPF